MESITDKHIESRPEVCGGKPCVAGTRIRIWDVHVMHNLQGASPEQIITAYPQLSLADVYAALAYYLDHREEIELQMSNIDAEVNNMEAEQGPTKFTKLRDALLVSKDAGDDSVSS